MIPACARRTFAGISGRKLVASILAAFDEQTVTVPGTYRGVEDKRARQRAKEKGTPRGQRKAPGRLVEGASVQGWKQALGTLALTYPDRLAPYLT